MAIASFILGLLGIAGISAILGVIFGFVALRRIRGTLVRGRGLALAGIVLGCVWVVVAVVVAIGLAATSSAGRQLTVDQLRPGDCLTGSNMGLGTSSPWPDTVTAVPCTQQHLAEVFFAANAWPRSLTRYPGNSAIYKQGHNRCVAAFDDYDGIPSNFSFFTFDIVSPYGTSDWASGDRWLVCVAHKANTPVNYSIKGYMG